ncbi:uncharacterized protein THITE_116197 [Thermothielavioides terrestris NRRL 8126]|uniref:Uncharacterized protein n=1 Tax=Thermothielavioides terrestris (strain ATCC 38088 / NRRL 8126) TaxID=578455 RepID=G2QVF3_THETT|nr:uncharacterized protein THITE_116197 [Thermothielavioides terrestris NRRL 8126]AEO64643.1 hypothetical protein THITE_116197 [Thermothielavioides terrestris NRRL 8126]
MPNNASFRPCERRGSSCDTTVLPLQLGYQRIIKPRSGQDIPTNPECADLESWLGRTFVTLSTGQIGAESADADPPAPKHPTCLVFRQPPTTSEANTPVVRRDLVLRSPHNIISGISILMMFSNRVAQASEAYTHGDEYWLPVLDDSEAADLSPSYCIAATVPPKLTQGREQRVKVIVAQRASATSIPDVEILALPFKRRPPVPSRHQRLGPCLEPSVMRSLAMPSSPPAAHRCGQPLDGEQRCILKSEMASASKQPARYAST